MNQSLMDRVIVFLKQKMRNRRWRMTVTCLSAVIVFATTYALVLPAITMTGSHPSLQAEEVTAVSGEELTVRVTAKADTGEREKTVILIADGEGADLSASYAFDAEGICVITDETGKEIELHRSARENGNKKQVIDYWFTLPSGEETSFTLDLIDEVDKDRFAKLVEAVQENAQESTVQASGNTAAAAGETGSPVTATASDAKKAAAAGTASSSNASRASGSNADIAEANAAATDPEERIVTEENDGGFVEILDGKVVNDLAAEDSADDEDAEIIKANLRLSAGIGNDYASSVKDAERNADKRGNAELDFTWTEKQEEHGLVKPDLAVSVGDAKIAVLCDDETVLPADARVSAYEIAFGTPEYEALAAQAAGAVAENAGGNEKSVTRARFFDITIYDGAGNEIQPEGDVKVVITYEKQNASEGDGEMNVVHFGEDGPEVMDLDAADTAAERDSMEFTASSFSIYGVVYTVDFEYELNGTVFAYKLDGGKSISLKTLIVEAGVLDAARAGEFVGTQVKSVSFSDGGLVKVTPLENDWMLESLESFTTPETLTVGLKDGRQFTVKVTDPPGPVKKTSSNLMDFLTDAQIDAPRNDEGAYIVRPGTDYSITLTFKERDTGDKLQFNNDTLTYEIPQGLNADGHEGTITAKIKRGSETYEIHGNTFSVENGVLTFRWNKSDPNYSQLTASPNVGLTITMMGTFDEDAESIKFSDSIVKDIEINNENSVTTSKSANVDIYNDRVYYTATVTSKGSSRNVVVTDTITGTGVTLDPASISAYSSIGRPVSMTGSPSGNSFQYTIPEIKDGEIVTFNYSASIDPSVLQMIDGKVVTQSGNKFKTTSDGDPEGDETEVKNTIDYTPRIEKSQGTVTGTDGTKQTLSWTLTVNPDAKVSAAGTRVTDKISETSQSIMKYSGSGITVKVMDANGNTVRTDEVTWDRLSSKTDSSWIYVIPEGDSGHAYKYEISYTTEVETKDLKKITTVENTVTTNGDGESTGHGQVSPSNGTVEIQKTADKVDRENKEITWTVTFTVPATGLDKAVVTDTFPNRWINGNNVCEGLVQGEGSLTVTGLTDGETYSVEYKKPGYAAEYAEIKFTKNGAEGLKGTGETRIITVTLKTRIEDDWVEASKTEGYLVDHVNKVKLDYGDKVETQASAKVTANQVKKVCNVQSNRTVNEVELPVYKYEVTLTGIESDNFTITDTFDTEILEPYTSGDDAFYVFGGDQYYQGNRGTAPVTFVNTVTGMTINVTGDSLPKNNGNYYTAYKLVYYLTVRDQAALFKLMQRAAVSEDGKTTLTNTVDWEGETDNVPVVYTYPGLDKEILTSDKDLKKTDDDIYADFRITLNPGALQMNNGEPLTMTDTVENLSVVLTSIQAVPSENVTWDMTGNTVTYTIPDATKVVITYRARVIFADVGQSGDTVSVNFSNEAVMEGFKDTIHKTAERKNSGQSAGTIAGINLLKYEAGNMTKRLQGAVFALYNSKLDEDKKEVIDKENPVVDKNGNPVTFTTGADGLIKVEGEEEQDGWSIAENVRYFLKEIVAPEGYMLADFDYSFKVSSDGTTDYEQFIYHSGDTMSAKNYPGTDVHVKKVWSDGNERHSNDSVTVKLQQKIGDGEWSDTIREEVKLGDNTYEWRDTKEKTLVLNTSNNWEGAFNSLPLVVPDKLEDPDAEDVSVEYQIVETRINDHEPAEGTVEYALERTGEAIGFDPETGEQIVLPGNGAYYFTVKNLSGTEIEVDKVWLNMEGKEAEWPDGVSVHIQLTADGTDVDGKTAELNAEQKSCRFTNLPRYRTDGVTEILYSVKETEVSGYTAEISELDASGKITVKNKPVTTFAEVRKVWDDEDNKKKKRPSSLEVTLLADGEPTELKVTLSEENDWSGKIDNLQKYHAAASESGVPVEIAYSWLEGDMPAGYFLTNTVVEEASETGTDEAGADGASGPAVSGSITTLTNSLSEYDLKTSYTGIKNWADENDKYKTRPDKLVVKLYADGEIKEEDPVWEKDDATNQWVYTFKNLPVFNDNGEIIHYTAEETTENVPAGYTLTDKNQTPTTGQIGEITYQSGNGRTTPDNKLTWTLGSLIDLSFVAIKPTASGDVCVWTHRVPTTAEATAIKNLLKGNALPGCSDRNIAWYSGNSGDMDTPHGPVHITYDEAKLEVTLKFDDPSEWSQFIWGQFNKNSSSKYNIGTTEFTNTLETTDLSGSKTWVINGTTVPENPLLTLTRTVPEAEGTPGVVKVKDGDSEVNLQPVWSGEGNERTFSYSGLPKKDGSGREYTYSVSEAQFTINGYVYTVSKNDDGTYTAAAGSDDAPEIQVTQTGNDITNTEVKDFEFSKIWNDAAQKAVEWPEGLKITVKMNAYTDNEQKALGEDISLTFSSTEAPDGWTRTVSEDGKKTSFKTSGLAASKNGKELTYYVVEVQVPGYQAPLYKDAAGNAILDEDSQRALDGQQIINTPEESVSLPSTGGPGTFTYALGGLMLLMMSASLYGFRMRRGERRIK